MTPGWDLATDLQHCTYSYTRNRQADSRGCRDRKSLMTNMTDELGPIAGDRLSRWLLIADRDITLLQYAR